MLIFPLLLTYFIYFLTMFAYYWNIKYNKDTKVMANVENKDVTVDRRSKILELLDQEGNVFVKDLSEQFSVSEVTIRNDLDQLEKKNLLIRAHGGAMKMKRVGIDYKLSVKSQRHSKEKQAIGKKAAELINDGETIILDSGSTTLEIMNYSAASRRSIKKA